MSVFNVSALKKPLPPTTAEIAAKLDQAKSALAELEKRQGALALDAEAGAPDAIRERDALRPELTAARDRVAELQSAHRAAKDRDAETLRNQHAALRQTQINAVRKHLEARDKAAEKLSTLIAEASEQYKVLIERSEKAVAACPVGSTWPSDGLCEAGALRRLVADEMWRLSGDTTGDQNNPRALPGSEASKLDYRYRPEIVPPMLDAIKKSSAFAIARLSGKAAA